MMKIISDGKSSSLYIDGKLIENITEINFNHKAGKDAILITTQDGCLGFFKPINQVIEDPKLKGEKKMRNIDAIAKNKNLNETLVCQACYELKHGKTCEDIACCNCEFDDNVKACFDFLQAEYKRPKIKLTKFEYDLLKTYDDIGTRHFKYVYILSTMKAKGYFKNVDTSRTIKDILENCEVEE